MEIVELVCKNPLFRNVVKAQIEELFDTLQYSVKQYKSKEFVVLQGELCNHLMIVVKGVVQGQMVDSNGRLIVIEEIAAPFAIATAFIFAEKNQMPVSVAALEDSEVLFIRREVFTDMLQQNRTILQNYLQMVSNRSKFLSDKIHFLTFKSLKSKIADYLLKEIRKNGGNAVQLEETQQQMADLFGVARPSLARTFKELELEGLIVTEKKRVTILNLEELKSLAQ